MLFRSKHFLLSPSRITKIVDNNRFGNTLLMYTYTKVLNDNFVVSRREAKVNISTFYDFRSILFN